MIDFTFGIYHYLGGELLEFAASQPAMRPLVRQLRPCASSAPLLFIHVPRSGGTSVRAAMGDGHAGHRTFAYYRAMYPAEVSRKTTFAVLRHPLSRFCSSYKYVVARGAEDGGMNGLNSFLTRKIRSLEDYIGFLHERRDALDSLDPVMRTQSHYVIDDVSRETVDLLFRLERDVPRLNALLSAHGYRPLQHLNRSRPTECGLDRAQSRKVEAIYARDMELYERVCATLS